MEKRSALGQFRGDDRIVSRGETYSLGDFMKFLLCGDPAPSITTSVNSKYLYDFEVGFILDGLWMMPQEVW